jgi:hypothetical protein
MMVEILIVGVAIVCMIYFLSPWSMIILLINLLMTIVCIYGFMYYASLLANGVTVTNIVMSVATVVALNVYIMRSFVIAKGTRNERMKEALYAMCLPSVWGALATFLGIVLMAGAKFPYFVIYVFKMYLIIVGIALFFGVFFMPVLLSLVGPGTLSSGNAYSALDNKKSPSHIGHTGGNTASGVQMSNTGDHVSPLRPGELPAPSAEGAKRNAWG